MILAGKNTAGENSQTRSILLFAGILLLALSVLFVAQSYSNPTNSDTEDHVLAFTDAESTQGDFFKGQNGKIAGAKTRSSEVAKSGRYSSKLDNNQHHGFTYEIESPEVGKYYKASVWMYRPNQNRGSLVVSAANDKLYHKVYDIPVKKNDDGWELLTAYFSIPDLDIKTMRIYTYKGNANQGVYFDDFKITEVNSLYAKEESATSTSDFRINIPKKGFEKLKNKKDEAVQKGILITADDDWTKIYIEEEGQEPLQASTRLKGDYLDHLQNDKWSMRVKMKGETTWHGMKTFSVQSPHTRSFLHEWLYHQMLFSEDVLTPRYDFYKVNFNQLQDGIYAVEEHFEKYLVESKNRREGPIIKLSEEGFWLGYKRQMDYYGDKMLGERMDNAFWKSEIQPFKSSKTQSSETLKKQYEVAQNLLFAYKYQTHVVSDIFDTDKLASMYAVMDILDAYHGRAWHNQRFYYNPVISKLEPIGYDGYGERVNHNEITFLGYYFDRNKEFIDFTFAPFLDTEFFRKYIAKLYHLSSPENIDQQIESFRQDIMTREKLIQSEYEDYRFDAAPIYEKARKIQNLLRPYDNISLQVQTNERGDLNKTVAIINKHCIPLDVVGYGIDQNQIAERYTQPIFIPNQIKGQAPEPTMLDVPEYAKVIYFQMPGVDTIYHSNIGVFNGPTTSFPTAQMDQSFDIAQIDFVQVIGKDIIIPAGNHQLKNDLIIQKDQQLIINPGVVIDMSNQANIISYGPVTMRGTAENPIHIKSSSKTAQSFTILQAPALSTLSHVTFSDLNTLNKYGWSLTGAVTAYESDIHLYNVTIENNRCEDALNLVRCAFFIDRIHIDRTLSDGFDADFCQGEIRNSHFSNTGNDGMDFSGSQITIGGTKIRNAGDKGISVGEASSVFVWNANIADTNMGVASKDESSLTLYYVEMNRCNIAYAAYQKKPEFGPATIKVNTEFLYNIKYPHQIEAGSKLIIGDQKETG